MILPKHHFFSSKSVFCCKISKKLFLLPCIVAFNILAILCLRLTSSERKNNSGSRKLDVSTLSHGFLSSLCLQGQKRFVSVEFQCPFAGILLNTALNHRSLLVIVTRQVKHFFSFSCFRKKTLLILLSVIFCFAKERKEGRKVLQPKAREK